jgi:hypothetical protein
MFSILINCFFALLFLALGGFLGSVRTEQGTRFIKSYKIYTLLFVLIIIQSLWLYAPIGMNHSFYIFIMCYTILGMFLLPCNNYKQKMHSEDFNPPWSRMLSVWVLLICFYLLTTSSIFNADTIGNRIDVTRSQDVTKFYHSANSGTVRKIPRDTAKSLASKALSEMTDDGISLGTVLEVNADISSIQRIQGKLYWFMPLQYTDMFKQFNYGGVNAYVLVDAHNQDATPQLIRSGKNSVPVFSMEKSYGGSFSRNLIRHFHSEYPTAYVSRFNLIADDNFIPYMVAYVVDSAVGFANYTPDELIIYDFSTDTFTRAKGDQIPAWIDVHVDIDTTMSMMNDWGTYRKGFLATIGNTFATKLTSYAQGSDMFFVPTKDGDAWFSGMSSTKSDDSLVDLLYVNTKTGKATLIKSKGVDEDGVVNAVQAKMGINADKWQAEMPIKYLITDDLDVWIMPITSNSTHLVQKIAIVDGQNINRVAIGDNLEQATNQFFSLDSMQETLLSSVTTQTLPATIEVVNLVGVNKSVIAYLRMANDQHGEPRKQANCQSERTPKCIITPVISDRIFECNTQSVPQCLILTTQDRVSLTFFTKDNGMNTITELERILIPKGTVIYP